MEGNVISRQVNRFGFTLLETVVVLVIVALLFGLLLEVIQKARAESIRLKSKNKLRQIVLATQNYATTRNDRLPGYGWYRNNEDGDGPFELILPFLEGEKTETANPYHRSNWEYIPAYVSPADISFTNPFKLPDGAGGTTIYAGDHSYPANWQAIRTGFTITASFADGTSNTIAYAERYSRCSETAVWWMLSTGGCDHYGATGQKISGPPCIKPDERRPTFADPDYDDVLPVTSAGETRPSAAGRTFQAAPTIDECDYRLPQTPHRSGMLAAFMDGSVRTIRPGVRPEVFWAMVTPAGGEVIADE